MQKIRCAIFDEGLDAQCACLAFMVRTVIREGEFPTCVYFCREHGDAHGAVLIDVAKQIMGIHAAALRAKDDRLVSACEKALLGDEPAIEECLASEREASR